MNSIKTSKPNITIALEPMSPTSRARHKKNTLYAILSMLLVVIQGTAMSIVLRFSRMSKDTYLPSVSVCFAEVIKLILCFIIQPFSSSSDTSSQSYNNNSNTLRQSPSSSSSIVIASSMINNSPGSITNNNNNYDYDYDDDDESESLLPISMPPPSSIPYNTTTNSNNNNTTYNNSKSKPTSSQQRLLHTLRTSLKDALPMSIPATMFVFQQVLLIWAATYLDAVSYQIFNQSFKLVPTAIFAYLLLGQTLSPMQWASMPVLAAGVIFVTINNTANTSTNTSNSSDVVVVSNTEWIMGMIACSISGLSSAFAGVYFEKYLKGKYAAGLVQRNIQLGIFGAPLSVIYAWVKDGDAIRKKGWLHGFTPAAWGVVGLQVFGGLVIGMVIKYCDNVLKNFSLAVSVILTVLLAIPLFNQWPSAYFLVGVSLVVLSVFMYSESISNISVMNRFEFIKKGGKWMVDVWSGKRRRVTLRMLGRIAGFLLFVVGTGVLFMSWKALQWQDDDSSSSGGGYVSMENGWDGGII